MINTRKKLCAGLFLAFGILFVFLLNRTVDYSSYIIEKVSRTGSSTLAEHHLAILNGHQTSAFKNPPKNTGNSSIKRGDEEVPILPQYTQHTKGQKVLLFTSYRSGSSFVGEILKRQENTFYTFEPFNFLQFRSRMSPYLAGRLLGSNASHYLSNLFGCNFQPLETDTLKYFPRENGPRAIWIPRCFNGARSFEEAEVRCKQRDNRISKIIRIKYLKDILKLLDEGVIIFHLIRDPRGTLSSRMKLSYDSKIIKRWGHEERNIAYTKIKAKAHCSKLSDNWQYLINLLQSEDSELAGKIRQQYLLIRYEDFAYHPEVMAKRLINTIRTSPPDSFYNWLKNTTNKNSTAPYGISRQANVTAEGWKSYLPFTLVNVIQEACTDVLELFGYTLVKSERDLSNMTKSFVSELPQHLPQL